MANEWQTLCSRLDSFEGALALIGTCKNAGKTTTLNFLLQSFPSRCAGVTSIGRDGERLDVVESLAKPPIILPEGSLFATARSCLNRCQGAFETLESTGFKTPLGEVLIARAEARCKVELAGPSSIAQLVEVSRRMRELGAARVLIDGAFDRIAGAGASLSDAVILAAGSAGRASVKDAAAEIAGFVKRFQLPVIDAKEKKSELCRLASLSDDQLAELEGCALVLPDPASCLIDAASWRWIDSGRIRVFVERQTPLLAVFVSSFRPHLKPLDAEALVVETRRLCHNIPVLDLKLEGLI